MKGKALTRGGLAGTCCRGEVSRGHSSCRKRAEQEKIKISGKVGWSHKR